MGAPITENIGNLGKLKEAVTLKRSMLTEIDPNPTLMSPAAKSPHVAVTSISAK